MICPNCGESNPDIAVMCWACYAAFEPNAKARRQRRIDALQQNSWFIVRAAGLGGVLASGWLPRHLRFTGLGAGVFTFAVASGMEKWQQQKRRTSCLAPDEEPIVRIANAIIEQAIKAVATRARIRIRVRGVDVFYQINGEWREQMKVPLYIWSDLRTRLRRMAGSSELVSSGKFEMKFLGATYIITLSEDDGAMYLDFAQS